MISNLSSLVSRNSSYEQFDFFKPEVWNFVALVYDPKKSLLRFMVLIL